MSTPSTRKPTVTLTDRKCARWGKVCDKCSSQCRSAPKSNTVVATVETPTAQDTSEVGSITGYIFGLHDATRTGRQQQIWDMQATMQLCSGEEVMDKRKKGE